MNPTRRSFLKGALTLTGVALVAPRLLILPRIVGDGVHDDSPGLRALLDELPCSIENGSVRIENGIVQINSGGTFYFGSDIEIKAGQTLRIIGNNKLVLNGTLHVRDKGTLEMCDTHLWPERGFGGPLVSVGF